jgi:hypothetical protein
MPARPLAALGLRLKAVAPPRLASLAEGLLVSEGFAEFMDLVRRYTLDYEAEVLRAGTAGARMAIFANHFRDAYFPLHWVFDAPIDGDVTYSFMTESIHSICLGWDDDDWHDIESRLVGHQLLFVLCQVDEGVISSLDEGMRVAALEACAKHIQQSILERLPPGGYARTELHRLLDGTEFEAAAKAVDWFHNDTGNGFLDVNDEMNQYCVDDWEPDVVSGMTELWRQADLFANQVHDLTAWLEKDTNRHFAQLLDFIERRKEVMHRDPRQIPLIELFSPSNVGD